MGAKVVCGQDKEDVADQVGKKNEQAILTEGITLKVGHDKSFDQQGNHKRNGQPDKWSALEHDQQDAIRDARSDIHDQGDGQGLARWIPSEKG